MTENNPPHPRTPACDDTCNNVGSPGEPQNDPMAAERARTAIGEIMHDPGIPLRDTADAFVTVHTVTWERDVNEAGVAVRRYVARSAWEVDPEPTPPADRSAAATVLRQVLDEIHGADEFGAHGAILRRDAEAIVRAVADNAGVVL